VSTSDPPRPRWGPPDGAHRAAGLNLAALGLLVWGLAGSEPSAAGAHLAALVLLVVAAASWVLWVVIRDTQRGLSATTPLLVAMAMSGGALAAFEPSALVFCGVAALGMAISGTAPTAAAVGVLGWLSLLAAALAHGSSRNVLLGGLAAVLAGLLIGITRREAVERVERKAQVQLETERAELERSRAEVLAERNRLAREIHDVLAHTLSALSLQLEAFGTVVDADPGTSTAIREQLARTRHLVREGLDEARGAVQALRDDAAPLDEQLVKLCAQHQAGFSQSGTGRPLSPPVTLALYRVAQEALTNVVKHAAGAHPAVALDYGPERVRLTVDNDRTSASAVLGETGGGYGLRGISERIALLGGRVEAGPSPAGWRVAVEVPT
jgi:signal transduction histidine kinase